MPHEPEQTVREILTRKKASIKDQPLPKGSPSWDDILDDTWTDIVENAKDRMPGYKTIKKLLGSKEYDR
jgi:hypothetical protein